MYSPPSWFLLFLFLHISHTCCFRSLKKKIIWDKDDLTRFFFKGLCCCFVGTRVFLVLYYILYEDLKSCIVLNMQYNRKSGRGGRIFFHSKVPHWTIKGSLRETKHELMKQKVLLQEKGSSKSFFKKVKLTSSYFPKKVLVSSSLWQRKSLLVLYRTTKVKILHFYSFKESPEY